MHSLLTSVSKAGLQLMESGDSCDSSDRNSADDDPTDAVRHTVEGVLCCIAVLLFEFCPLHLVFVLFLRSS